ncbi:unnamed protein product [Protopolystoma xenopodis]|uniref:Uncharacterized protein n=1 Tax=Protopolystoma xenopodis TaxID=117903 RepID=A0A3S5CSG9_9PLAT|nr:unnamed protein product [Protopolystoma xenopodis]VEL44425.1 unnamed protein product [Protopolystoma xenopodis]
MHRKANSPGVDFLPFQVKIWRRLADGARELVLRQSQFLRVVMAQGASLRKPVLRAFRSVYHA